METKLNFCQPVYPGMLIDTTVECDAFSAIPRMSNIPVNIRRLAEGG